MAAEAGHEWVLLDLRSWCCVTALWSPTTFSHCISKKQVLGGIRHKPSLQLPRPRGAGLAVNVKFREQLFFSLFFSHFPHHNLLFWYRRTSSQNGVYLLDIWVVWAFRERWKTGQCKPEKIRSLFKILFLIAFSLFQTVLLVDGRETCVHYNIKAASSLLKVRDTHTLTKLGLCTAGKGGTQSKPKQFFFFFFTSSCLDCQLGKLAHLSCL